MDEFGLTAQAANPELVGWYAGDMYVHRNCGGSPEAISSLYSKITNNNLATILLLANMCNGGVQNAVTDLPLVTGKDASVSTLGRIVHWDASYGQYPHPILNWVDQQNGIAGFVHMHYLDNAIPQSLNYCISIEYPSRGD